MTTVDNEELPRAGLMPTTTGHGLLALTRPAVQSPPPAAAPRPAARPRSGGRPARTGGGVPAALLLVDGLAVLAAVAMAAVGAGDPLATLWAACGLFPLLVLLNSAGGLYRLRLSPSVLDEFPALCGRAAVAAAFALTLDRCLHGLWPSAVPEDGRRMLLLLGCQLGLDVLGRGAVYTVVRRRRRLSPRPVLIAGAGPIGRQIGAALLAHPEYGLRPVGVIDSRTTAGTAEEQQSAAPQVPILGGPEMLDLEIAGQDVTDVIVTSGGSDDATAGETVRTATRRGCEVWFVPGVPEFGAFEYGNRRAAAGDHLWGFPCLRLSPSAMDRPTWIAKRSVDAALAAAGLLLVSPLLLGCALAVRIDGGAGVIFRQERVGLDGRSFTVLKFRTMRPADEHEAATRWNISQDHRLGATGRFLRRTSLDELPQLWNVLRGEMSLVGPRPERPYFVARFAQSYPQYRDRHRVPVGITGFAQVHGLRGDTSIEDRTRFDNYYIESWSLWQDVKILLRTAASVLRPGGS
ncbi:exopolysaccharide biosynthesis polyprenyl glycosylphosphotransferase [Streptacidiphilus albus]|uniref:exopolysaccharide biosynthesis polyprenyl glycosylphosphotransferase n=1 Tax=Streptacidiphilus albus TaxID=105425 RepID=UPI000693AF3D|nr:exopolysaccharide biosynthesis polyprenyl glycosylphosphotransferase [Streptacidiphilus albus]